MPLEKLIVDANAFIKGYPLEQLAAKVYTVPEVIREIRDSATKQRLKCIVYDLILEEPSSEFIKKASEYAKTTGDYASLSLVDIKLIALALKIHKDAGIPTTFTPPQVRTVMGSGISSNVNSNEAQNESSNLPLGFYMPKINFKKHDEHFKLFSYVSGYQVSESDLKLYEELKEVKIPDDFVHVKRWFNHIEKFVSSEKEKIEGLESFKKLKLNEVEEKSEDEVSNDSDFSEEESEEEDDDDEGGWITPSNYKIKPKDIDPEIKIGVLSTDFAIQNVILHTNIPLVSPDGNKISSLRSYILRCYACFFTTSQFEKIFCPRCGNKTLRKVSISISPTGETLFHFSKRFKLSSRGKKFSLPLPKGGKHGKNPILTEDQTVPEERRSKKSVARETGPFSMNDVNSRSFFMKSSTTHYWDARNPNAVKGRGRKK